MALRCFLCRRTQATTPHAASQLPASAAQLAEQTASPEAEKKGSSEPPQERADHPEAENATSGTNGAALISTAESDGVAATPASNQLPASATVSAAPAAPVEGCEKAAPEELAEKDGAPADGGENAGEGSGACVSPSPRQIPPEGAAEAARQTPDLAGSKGEDGVSVRGIEKKETATGDAAAAAVEAAAAEQGEACGASREKGFEDASARAEKRDSLVSASEQICEGVSAGVAGEESVRRRSGLEQRASLEEVLERKMKKLEAYLEEEQLFKAFSYVLLLEHQIDHRVATLNATLGLPPAPGGCLAGLFPDGERLADERRGEERKAEEGDDALSALRPNSLLPSSLLPKKQEDLRMQRETLLAFATRLSSSQELKNLCFEMRWAFQMLGNFHLDHLRQACEEPRLSVCDSFSSLPRSASCASQSSTFSFFRGTDRDREETRAEAAGAFGAKGSGAFGARPEREVRDEDSVAAEAALPERKLSTTKIKQGLRNMSRKMSLSRRTSTGRRSGVKKIMTAKKIQDDEGWIREKGRYLDLAYRVEKDSSVSMKVRGKLPCPLFEVLSILNETDLAGSWAPFFKSAEREQQYTKASQLVRQVYDYPLLGAKETLMFCVGINALEEAGCVIVFCRSPPENATEFLGHPVPEKRKLLRIQSADLVFLLYPIAEGRQTTLELYGRFQHGLRFVPMKIVTFVVKKVVRGMFVAIARQCQSFQAGPYRERVQNNPAFYSWMRSRIEEFVQQQKQGHMRNTETISLASFNCEEFQD
ncbi:UNVERIFIED_CONTAM: hypothetical protein HHA_252430 [Hammondia hammondi]|eukprot:XP_008888568.1 hypothetical protein HHA_252430 [Hammondia hammondi]